jgi:hypothetical protein
MTVTETPFAGMPRKYVCSGLAVCAGLLCVSIPAHAQDQFAPPAPYEFDGGPLGTLEGSAAVDGYFFAQSGASDKSGVGPYSAGARINAWMTEVAKQPTATDFWGFTVQAGEYQDINLGLNRPKNINGNRFQTGPIRSAYASIEPTPDIRISVGQIPSLEGFESVYPWNNPSALRTALNVPQTSNGKGVKLDYDHGPLSASLLYSDGYDTNDFNYLQWLASYRFDPGNQINVYGGANVGTTGPNAFAYGEGGAPPGGADGVGGQQQLAVVNSDMLGAWYSWRQRNLTIIPEVQLEYTPRLTQFANVTSGGISDDIPKGTGNFVAALFAIYKFADTPYSISGWGEYGWSKGSAAQDLWFNAPNQKLVGFVIAPAWSYNKLYARLDMGYVHLLDVGTPAAGYGVAGTGRNTAIGLMELGFVF